MTWPDPTTLTELFQAHAGRLVLYARQWLETAEAEDVVQEVFIRLAGQSGLPQEPRAWLFRSVRNAAINRLRGSQRRQTHETATREQLPPWFCSTTDDALDARAAQSALAKLPQEQREIVVLRIWGSLTFPEIAAMVDRPVSSVFVDYRQALAWLKEKLEPPCSPSIPKIQSRKN